MKYLLHPFVWFAITALVFVLLLITGVQPENPVAAWTFLPCLLMSILTGLGVFSKLLKK